MNGVAGEPFKVDVAGHTGIHHSPCPTFISLNPSIFTYDYEKIKENKKKLNEEIIIKALHPKRMLRLMEEHGEDEIYKCYFDDD